MNMDLNAVKSQSSQSSLHLRENRNPPALYLQRSLDLLLNIGVKMMSAHLCVKKGESRFWIVCSFPICIDL